MKDSVVSRIKASGMYMKCILYCSYAELVAWACLFYVRAL